MRISNVGKQSSSKGIKVIKSAKRLPSDAHIDSVMRIRTKVNFTKDEIFQLGKDIILINNEISRSVKCFKIGKRQGQNYENRFFSREAVPYKFENLKENLKTIRLPDEPSIIVFESPVMGAKVKNIAARLPPLALYDVEVKTLSSRKLIEFIIAIYCFHFHD
jgi:CRISPR/Cas system-associated endoribonuclease Cas2